MANPRQEDNQEALREDDLLHDNARPMSVARSVGPRVALPMSLAVIVLALGMLAMPLARYVAAFGFRFALLLSEALLVIPAIVAIWLFRIPLATGLGLRSWNVRVLLLSLAVGVSLWGASLGIFELQNVFWPPPDWYLDAFRRIHAMLRPSGPFDAVISVVAIAIAPAVCEEVLFRGVILSSVARRLGDPLGLVLSAALFGAIHLDAGPSGQWSLYRVPFACAVGLALGALRLKARSLTPSILSHATLNTITFLAAPLVDDPTQAMPPPNLPLGLVLFVIGTGCFVSLLRLFRIDLEKEPA
jgi:membrane protease YdiL (CAAX protease family)